MKKKLLLFAVIISGALISQNIYAQSSSSSSVKRIDRCATMEHLAWLKQQDPGLQARMDKNEADLQAWIKNHATLPTTNSIITIPVVFHIVYQSGSAAENISDATVQKQIDEMNMDYHKLNNWTQTPSVWQPLVADCQIQFCLASKDPNGAATTGVIHKSTTSGPFSTNDAVKYSAQGGDDAWPEANYLNIWSCDLNYTALGYTQFPGGPAATDGVVIDYRSFPGGTAPYNLGKTATHETGHWLNLIHVWGDDSNIDGVCGSGESYPAECNGTDNVADTPNQCDCNYGLPTFPNKDACSTASSSSSGGAGDPVNGNMFMNFMDYSDDSAMTMFTNGQNTRIQATLNGIRSSILIAATSYCSLTGVKYILSANNISIYPNPSTGEVVISSEMPNPGSMDLKVYNTIGQSILSKKINPSSEKIDLSDSPNGIYLFEIKTAEGTVTKKVIINR